MTTEAGTGTGEVGRQDRPPPPGSSAGRTHFSLKSGRVDYTGYVEKHSREFVGREWVFEAIRDCSATLTELGFLCSREHQVPEKALLRHDSARLLWAMCPDLFYRKTASALLTSFQ